MAVTRINDFHAAPGREKDLRNFLSSVIAVIKDSPGCLECHLLIEQENPAHLVIVEAWESVASHQAAASRIPPAKMAEVQPLLAEKPKGSYYEAAR